MNSPQSSGGPDLSETLMRRADQECDRFEAAWKAEERPRIEDHLAAVPEPERPALLAELVLLEIDYRRLAGEHPQADEFLERFPVLSRVWVEEVLSRAATHEAGALAPGGRAPWPAAPGFEILDELGRGGMGVVYRAWQVRLRRLVALKMVLAGEYASEQALARLRVEAEAVARLQHPNIVQIYEVGEHLGRPYFALEYVDGGSLANQLGGKPVPARPAAQLVETLARAMHYAHQQGIVHRDLKPGNILLARFREGKDSGPAAPAPDPWPLKAVPKISDFSLAKLLVGGGESQTQSGQMLGTPSYMAPEQAAGKTREITPAADTYALGAILYELLTGQPPFRGETHLDTAQQVVSLEPIPPRLLQPKAPRDLETICLKCLQKEPRKRYASAEMLAEDLRRFGAGEPIRARPVGAVERLWRWSRRNPLVASLTAAVAMLLIVATVGASVAAFEQHRLAEAAEQARGKAEQARNDAIAARNDEQTQRQKAEHLLERQYVARAIQLVGEGDLHGALPWLVECLKLAQGEPLREEMHRYRLAAVLHYRPQFVQVWFHQGPVRCAEFSPDGRCVATASDDHTAHVWDVATGKRVCVLQGHTSPVLHLAFSPDSQRVVTASADKTARVWNAATGETVTELQNHGGRVNYATFSPNGRYVITASSNMARLWDADTGKERGAFPHKGEVRHATFSPNDRHVVTVDVEARVWDTVTGKPVGPPLAHKGVVHASFSPDNSRVVTAGKDATARVWEVATGKEVLPRPLEHVNLVWSASFSPDGALIVTASHDATARVWNATTGELLRLLEHDAPVGQAFFSPDGRRVVTASRDRTARVWSLDKGGLKPLLLQHSGSVHRASFDRAGGYVLTASEDGTARLWDTGGPRSRTLSPKHKGLVRWASFSPDGRHVATASFDHTAQVWSLETEKAVILRHEKEVQHIAFSPDSRRVVTASFDRKARVWEVETGKPITEPLEHGDVVNHAEFSPDGSHVVTASLDGKARVWNASTGKLVRLLEPNGPVYHAAFSPVGSYLVTASRGKPVQVWDAATGKVVTSLQPGCEYTAFSPDGRYLVTTGAVGRVWDVSLGKQVGRDLEHNAMVTYAAFSPDGHCVVTASLDHTARIWDVSTGEPVGSPLRHTGRVEHLSFSPDGRRLVTVSYNDRRMRVWEVATGEPVTPILQHADTLWHVSFSPDGRRVLTACGDGTAQLWDMPFEDRPLADLVLVAQVLAGVEMRAPGIFVPLEPAQFRRDWATLWSKYPRDFLSSPSNHMLGQEGQSK
jgi:WD40 repeat protein/serine/threonine protein kinase